jgi:hypothetical protein
MTSRTVAIVYTAQTQQYEAAMKGAAGATRGAGRDIEQTMQRSEAAFTAVGVASAAMGAAAFVGIKKTTDAANGRPPRWVAEACHG